MSLFLLITFVTNRSTLSLGSPLKLEASSEGSSTYSQGVAPLPWQAALKRRGCGDGQAQPKTRRLPGRLELLSLAPMTANCLAYLCANPWDVLGPRFSAVHNEEHAANK
jgi:hypothetical protein